MALPTPRLEGVHDLVFGARGHRRVHEDARHHLGEQAANRCTTPKRTAQPHPETVPKKAQTLANCALVRKNLSGAKAGPGRQVDVTGTEVCATRATSPIQEG